MLSSGCEAQISGHHLMPRCENSLPLQIRYFKISFFLNLTFEVNRIDFQQRNSYRFFNIFTITLLHYVIFVTTAKIPSISTLEIVRLTSKKSNCISKDINKPKDLLHNPKQSAAPSGLSHRSSNEKYAHPLNPNGTYRFTPKNLFYFEQKRTKKIIFLNYMIFIYNIYSRTLLSFSEV